MKISKDVRIELNKLAAKLPITYSDVPLYRSVLGSMLIENGITELQSGEKVNPKKHYVRKISEKSPISNITRVIKIYKRSGIEGVRSYVNGVLDVNTFKPQQLGGLVTEQF